MSDTPLKTAIERHRAHNEALACRLGVSQGRKSSPPPGGASELARQSADAFASARASLRDTTERLDGMLGRADLLRAIDQTSPRVAAIEDAELRFAIELIFASAQQLLGRPVR